MPAITLDQPPQTPEYVPSLGRLHAPDSRDRQYLLPRPPRLATLPTYRYWLSKGPVLDQKETSACVGFSATRWITTHPVVGKPPMPPFELYRKAQAVDEWPGEEPAYYGTSVRAAFRVLKQLGYVSEYRWAYDLETVIAHLLSSGPVVVGTDWFNDMFEPDGQGYIWPSGGVAGGHAYLLLGANRNRKNNDGTKGAVQMLNSWGAGWGSNGRAWLTFDVLSQLIRSDGEAAVAKEIKAG